MTDLTIFNWLSDFEAHLGVMESTGERISQLTEFGQGFESWLKFEMGMLLTGAPRRYRPWFGNTPGDVGIEYRAALLEGSSKLIDLWASPRAGATTWHFVELKVAFNNYNAGKQFASWRADFESLRRIDRTVPKQVPESVGSVMFGAGFDGPRFDELVKKSSELLHTSVTPSWTTAVKLRQGDLRIAALIE